MRFRVVGHNLFNIERPRTASAMEEVLIQCKNNRSGKRAFYVRAPLRSRYQVGSSLVCMQGGGEIRYFSPRIYYTGTIKWRRRTSQFQTAK